MQLRRVVACVTRALIDALAPPYCAACGERGPGPSGFCPSCKEPARIEAGDVAGIPVFAGGRYEGSLVSAVHAFKYGRRPELAAPLAALMRRELERFELDASDAFVPVPLHAARLAERGYNQAALLARELRRGTQAMLLPRLLARESATSRQARLRREEREKNVRSAFTVRGKQHPRRVFLVDDVVTTGATARACVAALADRGLSVTAIFAAARAFPGSPA